ncbi:MAG: hypothetical protein NXI04_26435 [Planctomycetaceae bacterium]|nr:hypothetical protein [Planctomycetaceae bacterium]
MNKHSLLRIDSLEPLVLMSAAPTDGNDVLIDINFDGMVSGGEGHDFLIALAGNSQLDGGAGHDTLISIRGINHIDGGTGQDSLVYFADRSEYTFLKGSGGELIVRNDNGFWQDTVINVESLTFDDGTWRVEDLVPGLASEYRSIDGTGNNLDNDQMGSTDEQLLRISAADYADGISAPAGENRPSARTISNEVVASSGPKPNARGLTDMTWLWGQFLDHDISLTEPSEPHEPFNIEVPSGDALFDPFYTGDKQINMNRSIFDPDTGTQDTGPRQQINQITAFIDGSMVYGSDDVRAAELRSFADGKLRVTDDNLMPVNSADLPNADNGPDLTLFLAGDVRANENVALTAMHTVWVREHNRIAEELLTEAPHLTDEQVYQQARELVIAQIQAVTYNEFLPALLGDQALQSYQGYDPDVDASIATEFSTAAYRFGHSMLSSELLRSNNDGTEAAEGNIALQDAFFAPQEIIDHGIDSVLIGVTSQSANEIDNQLIDDVRNFLFGPPGAGGFDLASLNIQRGRDHGVASYNQVRADIGLAPVASFADITSDVDVQERLQMLYGTVDNIDLWVGGLAEDHLPGASMGATFHAILCDQFTRLRDGDRFWYENVLDADALQMVRSTTLSDVIERNTTANSLQDDVFRLA